MVYPQTSVTLVLWNGNVQCKDQLYRIETQYTVVNQIQKQARSAGDNEGIR